MLWSVFILTVIAISVDGQNRQRLCETNVRACKTGLCPVDECLNCEYRDAICDTWNSDNVIPRNLPPTTKFLDVTYTGPEIELTADMFDHLRYLHTVTIQGNIASVATNTFVKHASLKSLTISGSKTLQSLPKTLFSGSKKLRYLNLPNNQFREIPVNIFPNITNVTRLDFSCNPLNSCQNDTIGPEFGMLHQLDWLNLAGYGSDSRQFCPNISKDFFTPVRGIAVLVLSKSNILYGNEKILLPLTKLRELTIDKVSPYKECPALAVSLFENLPPTINMLTFRYWRCDQPTNESCILDGNHLTGLKRLTKLSQLDSRYSDKIFGDIIDSSIFSGFNRLRNLFIHWCGISSIRSGAFNALPGLSHLGLNGNLLGPRMLDLYTNSQTPKLSILNLNSVGVNTAQYQASNLVLRFSKLKSLYLDDNLLQDIPDFGYSRNITSTVQTLTLNSNKITSLSKVEGEKLCWVMSSLEVFKAEQNQLTDITGIQYCSLLVQVYFNINRLGDKQDDNFEALGQLKKLTRLHLANNVIKYIKPDMLRNLNVLITLNLANNEIKYISQNAFKNTPRLRHLDLSNNFLPVFDSNIVADGLSNLINLYLQDNQISTLSPEVLDIFANRMDKLERIGLAGNPLACSCDNYLSKWVTNSSTIIMQAKDITCHTPENKDVTTKIITYEPNFFRCHVRDPLMISGIVLGGVIMSVLLAVPCYKYRWYVRHPRVVGRAIVEKLKEVQFDEKCEYDAFISYDGSSDVDSEWMITKLLPSIEQQSEGETSTTAKMKLYVADRDSLIGSPKYTEKCRAIEASRKIIILLSNSYLSNPSCLSEANLVASYQLVDENHCYQPNRILVLLLEELNEETIKAPVTWLLTENVIHVMDNEVKMKRVWGRVRKFLSKPTYVYRKRTK